MENRTAVITFADKAGDYLKKTKRLYNSIPSEIICIAFDNVDKIGVHPHKIDPYAFKVGAIEHTYNISKFNRIVWCDSPLIFQSGFDRLETLLDKHKFFCYENIGYSVADFTNDRTLEYYDLNRKEAKQIPMVMACFFALDLINEKAQKVFTAYKQAQHDGMFKGSWTDHRHDQSCLSIIMHNLGIKPLDPFTEDSIFCYQQHIDRGLATKKNKVFIST